jgi:hypothetical protein
MSIDVGQTMPRLLQEGAPAPDVTTPPPIIPPVVAAQYWTEDRAAKAYAQAMKGLSHIYGEGMKASAWECEMVGVPLAAVLTDWWPVKPGEGSDKRTNLLILAAVLALFMLMRLPIILEFHRRGPHAPAVAQTEAPPVTSGVSATSAEPTSPTPAPTRRGSAWEVIGSTQPTAYSPKPSA